MASDDGDNGIVGVQHTLDRSADRDRVTAVIVAARLEPGDVIEQPRPQPILRVDRDTAEGDRVRVVFADGTSRWYAPSEPVMAKVPEARVQGRQTVSTMPGKSDPDV